MSGIARVARQPRRRRRAPPWNSSARRVDRDLRPPAYPHRRQLPSRPYGDNAWNGKPVAVMGASFGMLGTVRAQYHLRQVFVFLNMYPVNQPEVMIAYAAERFDAAGTLLDAHAQDLIRQLLRNLVAWSRLLQQGQEGSV
jgi:hypothetical protein